jgi:integrase
LFYYLIVKWMVRDSTRCRRAEAGTAYGAGTSRSDRDGIPYFRLYDLRSTYATRLSACGVADEWVTQLLHQGDSQVFKKYSQMKLQMKREALQKLNRQASEVGRGF